MAAARASSSEVSTAKYRPRPSMAVGALPRIPRYRHRVTPAGWAPLVELAIWAVVIWAAWHSL